MTLSKKTLVNSALALAIGAVMTGCATPVPSTGPAVFQNQVQVAESIERLELYTRPNGLELSARDLDAVDPDQVDPGFERRSIGQRVGGRQNQPSRQHVVTSPVGSSLICAGSDRYSS